MWWSWRMGAGWNYGKMLLLPSVASFRLLRAPAALCPHRVGFGPLWEFVFPHSFFGPLREICESPPSLGAAHLWWSWSVCARCLFRMTFFPRGRPNCARVVGSSGLVAAQGGRSVLSAGSFFAFPYPRRPFSLPIARGDVSRSGPHFWWS